jgi:hypothetical protein
LLPTIAVQQIRSSPAQHPGLLPDRREDTPAAKIKLS